MSLPHRVWRGVLDGAEVRVWTCARAGNEAAGASGMRIAALFAVVLVGCVPGMFPARGWGVNWSGVATPTEPAGTGGVEPVGAVVTNTTAASGNVVVYVHGGGGRVLGGSPSDAPRWVSSTVTWHGMEYADFPAFEGTQAEWREMMTCSQSYFAGFPVTLVDQQPQSGDYLLAVVGGSSKIFHADAWGEADTGVNDIVERGTAFVFSADHQTDRRAQRLCETLSHEIGHMLGLNHSEACQDLMSANAACVWDGPRPGFLEDNRRILATHLARFGESAASTQMTVTQYPIGRFSDGAQYWQVLLDARKPVARGMTYKIEPDGVRSEWPCQVDGNGCAVFGNQVSSVLAVPKAGTWQMQFEVFYTDGTSARSDWFSTQVQ